MSKQKLSNKMITIQFMGKFIGMGFVIIYGYIVLLFI